MYQFTTCVSASPGKLATKEYYIDERGDVQRRDYGNISRWKVEPKTVASIKEMIAELRELSKNPKAMIVMGGLAEGVDVSKPQARRSKTDPITFIDREISWAMFDFDKVPVPAGLDMGERFAETAKYFRSMLPAEFHDVECIATASSSTGRQEGKNSGHLFFKLKTPRLISALFDWAKGAKAAGINIDHRVFQPQQPLYTARPIFCEGLKDPVPENLHVFTLIGKEQAIDIDVTEYRQELQTVERETKERVAMTGGSYLDYLRAELGGPSGYCEPLERAIGKATRAGVPENAVVLDVRDIVVEYTENDPDRREKYSSAWIREAYKSFADRDAKAQAEGLRALGAAHVADWAKPRPLPDGLLPVKSFDPEYLPANIGPWVVDISERMQCPIDFPGSTAMIALGAQIGAKIGIRPKAQDDWTEFANLWGVIVGRPGTLKSPAQKEVLAPLMRTDEKEREEYKIAMAQYAVECEIFKVRKEAALAKFKKDHDKNINQDPAKLAEFLKHPDAPVEKRIVVMDATYEKLGEILKANTNGCLMYRDEIASQWKYLDRPENAIARSFILSSWNGGGSYSFDRIGRGSLYIPRNMLSLVGSTQPSVICDYIRSHATSGAGDDGLIQRFGLMVWPDQGGWSYVDRTPNMEARQKAAGVFNRVSETTAQDMGATVDLHDPQPYLRFDRRTSGRFTEYLTDLENRVRDEDLSPALASHFSKYKKLVPAVALINHVADVGKGAVGIQSLQRAIQLADYLETHARRTYSAGTENETRAAKAIVDKIRAGAINDGFTAREITQHNWSALNNPKHVEGALAMLIDLGWLAAKVTPTGGRPRVEYQINPQARM